MTDEFKCVITPNRTTVSLRSTTWTRRFTTPREDRCTDKLLRAKRNALRVTGRRRRKWMSEVARWGVALVVERLRRHVAIENFNHAKP